jgi:hypothetical protein
MHNCPYCPTENSNDLNFCIECEKQIRCLSCSSSLYAEKSRCLKCGEPIKAVVSSSKESMNTYILEEESTTESSYRRIEVKASDNAVDALTGRLPLVTNSPLSLIPINIHKNNQLNNSSHELPPPITVESERSIPIDSIGGNNPNILTPEKLFAENSEHGFSPSKTFRDYLYGLSSKKEKQQVYALMYVWVHNQELKQNVSHENLIAAMKHEDLYDSNSTKHLQEVSRNYFKMADNHYEITKFDGAKKIQEILENIQIGKQPQASTEQRKNGKRGGRPTGSANKAELEKITPWLDLPIDIVANFDTRKLTTTSEWGAFGLYILTKVLKVAEAIDSGLVYVYLSKKFSKLAAKRKTFTDSIRESKNKFSKNVNGSYFLTSEAEKAIKEIIEASDDI